MENLTTKYNFEEIEAKYYNLWLEQGYFHATKDADKKPFVIVIPPPNITGILHMGHALNNTIQDILIRYKKMRGFESLWMPGTDHAGIATQNVVERKITNDGLSRHDLGREKFLEKVWQWRQEYGSTIIRQLKRLGCACDWSRERFTLDAGYSDAVLDVFVNLYKKGLIYQGNYIINWCPRCQTALSDEEAPHKDMDGFLYYIRYPLKDSNEHIVVATTRPETMLGDTAVAVNPKDKRYKKIIGKTVILPLMNRQILIIKDDFVDPRFGTGAVKVTPAHDPNDYALGKRHSLEFVNIMHPDATLNENALNYAGQDRFKARAAIIEDLKERGLLLKVEAHKYAVGHCYRCHTIIEPYLSRQWFVKMKPLSLAAKKVVKDGKVKFYPPRWTKVYLNWMENIQDWCISRQIWWGHRLPVYYCKNCYKPDNTEENVRQNGVIVAKTRPARCPDCGKADIVQDEDVLDTWFSSWLWPFATFGWPDKKVSEGDLKYFYPTSVLVTAQEIIFFWVARMIMAGLEFMQDIPFKDVYIHGTVRDKTGKKMSKSLGNIIDPLEIIKEYGTDALRFSLISITAMGQDVYLAKDKFELGRNFSNKIWNAARFILMNLDTKQTEGDLCVFYKQTKLSLADSWVLSRFYSTLKALNQALNNYRFNEAAGLLYEFFWHEFCDWYIELAKLNIKERNTQFVLYKILEKTLRALHPFMPFITEEIWQKLNPEAGSIMQKTWPHVQENLIDRVLEKKMAMLKEVIVTIRNLRSKNNIKPKDMVEVSILAEDKNKRGILKDTQSYIEKLARVSKIAFLEAPVSFGGVSCDVASGCSIYLHINFDAAAENKRIEHEISQATSNIKRKEELLKNSAFIAKAPVPVVEKEKKALAELKADLKKLEAIKYAVKK
ncbi:MAG: valine--tRNA ligase [Candidatus Omnitrophota bacterium]